MIDKHYRHIKINFDRSMQQFYIRKRNRRTCSLYFRNVGKDKIWHRAVKRSIKYYEKKELKLLVEEYYYCRYLN